MSTGTNRVWFAEPLETVATFWRVLRRDGVVVGLTSHDRDLWFDGVLHRATPGMVPTAIRRSADFEEDSAEVEGALSHEALAAEDLAAGRFDGARVLIGLIDWESGDSHVVYRGTIGEVGEEAGKFNATLKSRKAELVIDPIPRTSPGCRAEFCGPGCTLSAARFTHRATITASDTAAGTVTLAAPLDPALLVGGVLRWLDGPLAGLSAGIVSATGATLRLDAPFDQAPPAGSRVLVVEGCDHTLATCVTRFGNAINFQGEPFLPGNDHVTRYGAPAA